MCRESKINQFIPLHFYEVSEKLPDDDLEKIVILHTAFMGDLVFLSRYDTSRKMWEYRYKDMEQYFSEHVVAWATFDAEWVTGSYPGKWGTQ